MKRVALTLVVTGLCTAYILWKIDLGKTGHVLATARIGWWLLSLGIMVVSVFPMACAGSVCSRRAACTTRCRGSSARTL